MSRPLRMRWIWIAAAVVAADMATKYAVERFTDYGSIRSVIPGFFNLVHTRNPGIAFGLLADRESPMLTAALVLFALAAMGLLGWLLASGRAGSRWSQTGLALVLGGAAGNLFDRLRHGAVVDFLDFHVGRYHYPAFNLADSAILAGAALVIFEMLRPRPARRGRVA
jgi:signal peptidase II